VQKSDEISDHYSLVYTLFSQGFKADSVLKYIRPITSATKDCFINNIPDHFLLLSIPDSLEELDF